MTETLDILPLDDPASDTLFSAGPPLALRNLHLGPRSAQTPVRTTTTPQTPSRTGQDDDDDDDRVCSWLALALALAPAPTPTPSPQGPQPNDDYHHHHHYYYSSSSSQGSLHADCEAGSACLHRLLGPMLVTAYIVEHAGTIGNTTTAGVRKDPATTAVSSGRTGGTGGSSGGPGRKRNSVNTAEDDDGDDREPDEGERPRSAKRVRPEDAPPGQQASFACPFFKMNPVRHQACLFYKMSKISYVKQHLQRTHRGPRWRCTACRDAFPDQAAYNRHLTTRECRGPGPAPGPGPGPHARQDDMSELQWEEIGRLTSRRAGATTESMWYAMYDVLFPGTPRPGTPYVESGISEMTKHFRDFVKDSGPAIVQRHLEASGGWQSLVDSGLGPDTLLQFVMTAGIDLVFEDWSKTDDGGGGGAASPATTSSAGERHAIPLTIFRGDRNPDGVPFQFPPRSQPPSSSSSATLLPPVAAFYDVRSPLAATEPPTSPHMYHTRVLSSLSAPETPVLSEASAADAIPPTGTCRPRGTGSHGSGSSVEAGPESTLPTPNRGPRDLSISALTGGTATSHPRLLERPRSKK